MPRRPIHAALTAAALLALMPAVGRAETVKVDVTAKAKITASGLSVKLTGQPIGTCRGTATLTSTGALFKARCKGGRLRVRITFKKGDQSRGTWKYVSGTGRYRGAKGSGRYKGNLRTLRFHMTGTASR